MTDVDALADFDSAIGAPIFDSRTAATRWLDALGDVPTDPRPETQSSYTNFGPVGAGTKTKKTERSRPTLNNKHRKQHNYDNRS